MECVNMKFLGRLALAIALLASPVAFAQNSATCPAYTLGAASTPITATTYTIGQTDQCLLKVFNSGSAVTVKLPPSGTAGGFYPAFPVSVWNMGAGTVTLTPQANIAGTTPTINGQSTLALTQGRGAQLSIGSDGNWYANTSSTAGGGATFGTITFGSGSTVGGTLSGGASAATIASTGGPLIVDAPSTNGVYVGGSTTANSGLQVAPGTGTIVNQVVLTPAATGTAPSVAAGGPSADANANLSVAGTGTGIVLLGQTICTVTGATPQTCNGQRGIVTTGTLTTATSTASTYQINNSSVTTSSMVQCTLQAYSGTYFTNGIPVILDCKPGSGSITVDFANINGTNALNGTLAIGFAVLN